LSSIEYRCRHECGFQEGSLQCLSHQLRKLAEEVAEVQEALFQCFLEKVKSPEIIADFSRVREEWSDVLRMIHGIEKHHPWIKGEE